MPVTLVLEAGRVGRDKWVAGVSGFQPGSRIQKRHCLKGTSWGSMESDT